MIRVNHLTKRFDRNAALSDVSFSVGRGEAVALCGSNGAGKTTLLRCLLGIVNYEGEINILKLDVRRDGKKVRSLIGYVPQEIRMPMDQSVWETLRFYAALRGAPKPRARAVISEWGLAGEEKKSAQNLSGGMKQKLALAAALLSDPPLLLLDEPASQLDAATRQDFEAALKRLKAEGKTLIFCSHRESEIKTVADRVIRLEKGALR